LIVLGTLFVGALSSARFPKTQASLLPRTATSSSQNERKLTRTAWKNEPIQVSKVKQKKGLIEFDKTLIDDDDWLNGLTLSVKNTANKDIFFIEITITLFNKERGHEHRTPVQFPLQYGNGAGIFDGPKAGQPVKPGESVDVALSDENYEELKRALSNDNYPLKFHHVDVRVDKVIFADRELWYKSYYFYPDPCNPSKYIRDKYFLQAAKSC
jgi:hypothetical protein